jgi:cytochrome c-type biogenesis protein CcmF
MPQVYSNFQEDVYLVYEGMNDDTKRPIIKAHLNALVMWIWLGAWMMLIGTGLAMVPNAQATVRAAVPALITDPARNDPATVGAD